MMEDGTEGVEEPLDPSFIGPPPLASSLLEPPAPGAGSDDGGLVGTTALLEELLRVTSIGKALPIVLESPEAAPVLAVIKRRLAERTKAEKKRLQGFMEKLSLWSRRDRKLVKDMSVPLGCALDEGPFFYAWSDRSSEASDGSDGDNGGGVPSRGLGGMSEGEFDRYIDHHTEIHYHPKAKAAIAVLKEASDAQKAAHQVAASAGLAQLPPQ